MVGLLGVLECNEGLAATQRVGADFGAADSHLNHATAHAMDAMNR